MEFFKNLKNSIYSPNFYQELLAKPFSYSFKYFILLAIIISLLVSIIFSFMLIPGLKIFFDNAGEKMLSYYPADLKINIKDGQVSTNVPEPYFVKMPNEIKPENSSVKVNTKDMSNYENLLVIDTKNNFTVDQFASYKTFALLTNDSVIAYDKNGNITISKIEKTANFALDKPIIEGFINKVKPFIKFIYPIIAIFIFIASMFVIMLQMAYLLFGALFVWLAAKIKGVKIGYKKSYQLALHLITILIIARVISMISGINNITPFLFTFLLFILALINIKKINNIQ